MATKAQLARQEWRLDNLYYIKDKTGSKVRFKLNWAQKYLLENMWYLNLLLKARQIGGTTFIQLYMLDCCLFNSNVNAGVIAHNREDASKFFKDKIKFAYDNLPDLIKSSIPATSDSVNELAFANDSSIRVGTSLRSGTYQYLHISEYGKLCAKFPERAEEVRTGALNTVASGQFVFIESTAEGDYGDFYEMCMEYMNYESLTKMDYKFFFFPWHKHPDYVLSDVVDIQDDLDRYFEKLEDQGISLSDEQKYWYAAKKKTQKGKMGQEYPSTPHEAFEQISEFSVYGKEIGSVIESDRLTNLPITGAPIDLFFDIGRSAKTESTCVWFMQHNDPWYDFVDYYQDSLKKVSEYVANIRAKGYSIGRWYIPHDAESSRDYSLKTFKDRLVDAGVSPSDIIVVPRVDRVSTGIDMMRDKFPACRFDSGKCADGWKALKAYKYQWDTKKSIMGEPIHDWASHPSDSIRQFAQGYSSNKIDETITMSVNSYW